MVRWLRVVVPVGYVVGVAIFYAVLEVLWRAAEAAAGVPGVVNPRPTFMVLYIAALVYGLYRALAFHPMVNSRYRAWLATTPWTPHKPLPVGPIHLVWQDVLLVGLAAAAVGWTGGTKALIVPLTFLVGYLLPLAVDLAATGEGLLAYAVGFGLGLVVRLLPDLPPSLVAAAATYLLAYVGLRRSLRNFPWEGSATQPAWEKQLGGNPLGWPFARLGPKFLDAWSIRLRTAALTSLLVGWWFHAVAALQQDPGDRWGFLFTGVSLAATAVPGFRLLVYLPGYAPPINLLGRLATGRWLIPGYDQVFVAPLLALWVGVSLPPFLLLAGVNELVAMPLGLTVVLFLVLAVGPSVKTWRLTGHHRIVPAGLQALAPRRRPGGDTL
jgi:hypothetical protein